MSKGDKSERLMELLDSEWFHRNPQARAWKNSYTRYIVEEIEPYGNIYVQAAAKLLRGYWRDLHVPYEQRDAARKEAAELSKERDSLRDRLAKVAQERAALKAANEHLRKQLNQCHVVYTDKGATVFVKANSEIKVVAVP